LNLKNLQYIFKLFSVYSHQGYVMSSLFSSI